MNEVPPRRIPSCDDCGYDPVEKLERFRTFATPTLCSRCAQARMAKANMPPELRAAMLPRLMLASLLNGVGAAFDRLTDKAPPSMMALLIRDLENSQAMYLMISGGDNAPAPLELLTELKRYATRDAAATVDPKHPPIARPGDPGFPA